MACVWDYAAGELGRRHIPLAIPLVQWNRDWVWGYLDTVSTGTIEEDAKRFVASTNVAERYHLWHRHREAMIQDPDDPFGPKVQQIAVLTGVEFDDFHDNPPLPNYEDALALLHQS